MRDTIYYRASNDFASVAALTLCGCWWRTSSSSGVGCGALSAAARCSRGKGLSLSCHEKARKMQYAATMGPAETTRLHTFGSNHLFKTAKLGE